MVSNDSKKKNAAGVKSRSKRSVSDVVFSRIMTAFVAVVVGVFGILFANKKISIMARFITYVLPVLLVLSALAVVGAVVFYVKRGKSDVDERKKLLTGANVLGAAIIFALSNLAYRLTFDEVTVVYILVSAFVLYFVWHSFGKDFFAYSALTSLSMILLHVGGVERGKTLGRIFEIGARSLVVVLGAAAIVLGLLLRSGKGTLKLGSRSIRFFNENDGHVYPLIIGGALAVASGVAAFVVSSASVFAISALAIVYVVIAIIYVLRIV